MGWVEKEEAPKILGAAPKGRWVEAPRKQGMSHPPPSKPEMRREQISQELGYNNVDWNSEITGLDRADLGLSESNVNKMAKIRNKYPDYDVRDMYGRIMVKPPNGKWHPLDSPKFTIQDISDFSGEVLPLAGSLAAISAGPPGIAGAALAGGLGTVAGRMAGHGYEWMRGYEPPEEHVSSALGEGAIDTGLGYAGGGIGKLTNTMSGRGAFGPHPEVIVEYKQLYDWLRENPEMPFPLATQVTQEGNSVNRMLQQANAMSVEAKNKLLSQSLAAGRKLTSLEPKGASVYRAGDELKSIALGVQERARRSGIAGTPAQSYEKTGFSTKSAMDKWLVAKDKEIGRAYTKVGSAAATEQPLFNLIPAKEKFKELGVYGTGKGVDVDTGILDATGSPMVKQIWPMVNAAETPGGKLRRVGDILNQLDDTQTNWQVIKELRSSVGKIIKNTPWDTNIDMGSAKQMYGALTGVLENPSHTLVNGVYRRGASGAYKDAIIDAGRRSKSKFNVLSKSKIRHIIQTDDPRALGDKFSRPGGMTPEVRDVLSTLPDHKEVIKLRAIRDIAHSKEGARNALEEWYRKDEDTAKWLFSEKEDKFPFELFEAADTVDNFNSSVIAQIKKNDRPLKVAETMLKSPDMSNVEIRQLLTQVGGRGSRGHDLLKAAMLSDIIYRSKQVGDKTGWTVDRKSMQAAIKEYRKNGAFNMILSPSDQKELLNIERYARFLVDNKTDMGVSLVSANVASGFKHPSSFVSSARELTLNKVLADMAMNPKVVKGMSGVGKTPFSNKVFAGVPIILESLSNSVFADPAVEELMAK